MDVTERFIVGITGASGTIYGVRLLQALLACSCEIHLIVSDMGAKVASHDLCLPEEGIENALASLAAGGSAPGRIMLHNNRDMFAPVASGSFQVRGMAVIPCSMKTMAAVASGYTSGLLERAADVTLKERRTLVLVPRETPLSRVHLKNMLAAQEAGAIILPASPAFYHHPETVDDLVDFVVERVMDTLGVPMPRARRWGTQGRKG